MGERWQAVDDYIAEKLLGDDDALAATLANNAGQGLPPIDVSPAQGKMLFLLAQMAGAKRILEVGTLGGYSTIWLARALPEDGGSLVTLELEAHHARSRAREPRAVRSVSGKIDIRIGPAADGLAAMDGRSVRSISSSSTPTSRAMSYYVDEAIRLGRPGTTIIVDNVVREGGVLDAGQRRRAYRWHTRAVRHAQQQPAARGDRHPDGRRQGLGRVRPRAGALEPARESGTRSDSPTA